MTRTPENPLRQQIQRPNPMLVDSEIEIRPLYEMEDFEDWGSMDRMREAFARND